MQVGHCSDSSLAKSTTIKVVEKFCRGNGEKKVTKWETKVKSPCHESPCCSPQEKTSAWGTPDKNRDMTIQEKDDEEDGDIITLSAKKAAHNKPDKWSDKRSTKAVTGSADQSGVSGGVADETTPITIESSAFTKEELETLITSLDESGSVLRCENCTWMHCIENRI